MKPTIKDYIKDGTIDWIVVYAESRFETNLNITGENEQTISLELDGEYEDDKKRIWGTVVAIPKRITPDKVMWHEDEKPIRMDQIQMDVNPGEKLYFEYLALGDSTHLGENHYAVSYDQAYCVVREGRIVPIGSHVLLKPVYPDDCIEIEKGIYGRQNSFGIVTETNVPPKPFEAIVRHVGLPLKGRNCEIEPRQRVGIEKYQWGCFRQNEWQMKQLVKIEGEEYLICRQSDIAWIFQD